jgi:hypothetical protein
METPFITRITNKLDRYRQLPWLGRFIDANGTLDVPFFVHEQTLSDRYKKLGFTTEVAAGTVTVEYFSDLKVRPMSEYGVPETSVGNLTIVGEKAPEAKPLPVDVPAVLAKTEDDLSGQSKEPRPMFNSPVREDGMPGVDRFSALPTVSIFDGTTRSDLGSDPAAKARAVAEATPGAVVLKGPEAAKMAAKLAAVKAMSPVDLNAPVAPTPAPATPAAPAAPSKRSGKASKSEK